MIIRSFNPWVYNGDLKEFISPPFDTISKEEEAILKEKKDNITHITLPDNEETARDMVKLLVSRGKLKRTENSILIIIMEYERAGIKFKIPGIMSMIDSQDPEIITHERTFRKFVDERVNLMRAINGQPEPIFVVTKESSDQIIYRILENGFPELINNFNYRGISIKVYKISKETAIEEMRGEFNKLHGIVADGHHRLEASKALYGETGNEFWRYVMSFIVSLHNDGLNISGVHRIVNSSIDFDELEKCISEQFIVHKRENHSEGTMEIYRKHFFEINPKKSGKGLIDDLPVSLVNNLIFKNCLKWTENEITRYVHFIDSYREVIEKVDSGNYSLGIIMPPFSKDKFEEIASQGIPFPQKSTFFNPKIPSGIAMNLNF